MKNTWVNVALFEGLNDGKILEEFLRDHGILARTYNDRLLQSFLFLCQPHMTYRVQVPESSRVRTVELLAASLPEILQNAIHCPDCGSLRVNYPQMTRKFFLPTVMLHLGILSRLIDHQCYCENCHWMWSLPKPAAPAAPPTKTTKPLPLN